MVTSPRNKVKNKARFKDNKQALLHTFTTHKRFSLLHRIKLQH